MVGQVIVVTNQTSFQSAKVEALSTDHFGVNALITKTSVDIPIAVGNLSATTLRYPGGAVTEQHFDIANPERSLANDGTTPLIPLLRFSKAPQKRNQTSA